MKTVQLIQGTPEWLAHRCAHRNASEAAVMLGVSPHVSRPEMLRVYATGIEAEIGAFQQRIFDNGHRFEAWARPLAEKIIGEELYPVTGVDGRMSASFDGLTLLEDISWEHKSLNAELRAAFDDMQTIAPEHREHAGCRSLPIYHRVQMEQGCMVSGAGRVLFMASLWTDAGELIEERHCWYTPDPELRARIVSGWEQFERDLAAYSHVEKQERRVTGRTPETLPALRIEARGMVTASNLAEFKSHALAVLGNVNRDLQTDDDFADAEATVKWCKGVEDRLEATKASVLGQMADIDAVCRTLDDVAAETRRIRLDLDKLVKAEKDARKAEIVRAGVLAVQAHYVEINTTMGEHAIGIPPSLNFDIGNAIKGLKTLSSIRDKISTAVACAKIDASERAERVRKNVATLAEFSEHAHLFADRVQLCATKAPDDLRNLASMRVAEHKRREEEREQARQKQEAERLEQQREQIRQEELARIERERSEAARIAQQQSEAAQVAAVTPEPASVAQPLTDIHGVVAGNPGIAREHPPSPRCMCVECCKAFEPTPTGIAESGIKGHGFRYTPVRQAPRIKLGDINAAIAPLSITADGLARLGFNPVATDKAAKLYEAATFEQIRAALLKVLTGARAEATTAAAA